MLQDLFKDGTTLDTIAHILEAIITLANITTIVTPSVVENPHHAGGRTLVNIFLKCINVLALNIFKNKNADEVVKLNKYG